MTSIFRRRPLGRRGLFKCKYVHVANEHNYNESSQPKLSSPVSKIQKCLSFPFIPLKSPNLSRISAMLELRQSDDDLPLKLVIKRLCRDRAIFIASRLQQKFCDIFYGLEFCHDPPSCVQDMDTLSCTLARLLACRLYTLDYLSKAYSPKPSLISYLAQVRSEVQSSQHGALEAYFAVYWVLEKVFSHAFSESQKNLIVERARDSVITTCLKSEEWLSPPERVCMYVTQICVTDMEWEGVEVELMGVPMEMFGLDF